MRQASKALLVIPLLMFMTGESFGVGSAALGNQTVSAKVNSHGFAFAGVADDPTAIFYNPAGLTQVKGFQYVLGGTLLDFSSEHTAATTSLFSAAGQTDKMDDDRKVIPNAYVSFSGVDSRWAYGLSVNSPFGLSTEWRQNSFSNYYANESRLFMYNVNPTVAFSAAETVSFGFGLDYFDVFDVELTQQLPGFGAGGTDGTSRLTGDGTGWGYNAAVHWKPSEAHNFGLSYRSQVNVNVEGDSELINVGGLLPVANLKRDASTTLKFPQSVLIGYGFKPSEKWTFFFDYEWVNWKIVDNTHINLAGSAPSVTNRRWNNSNNIGAGTEYGLNEHVDLRGGFGVYEQVIPSETLEAQIPSASRWFLTFGTGLHFGNTSFDLGYNAVFFKDRSVANSQGGAVNLNGDYETFIHAYYFGLSQKWGGEE